MSKSYLTKIFTLVEYCLSLNRWEELLAEIPELIALQTTPQDPVYHGEGDVWTHTKMVLRELFSLNEFLNLTAADKEILCFSALFHDIAKPITTVVDEVSGKISQPGHSAKGAVDTRIFLWEKEVDFLTREKICALIIAHQHPFFVITHEDPRASIIKLSMHVNCEHLAILATADLLGRICPDLSGVLLNVELFKELAQELNCFNQAFSFPDTYTKVRYLRGEQTDPYFGYHVEQGSFVTLLCGMPASGKNTWVSKNNNQNLPVLSFDDAKTELGLRHGQNDGMAAHFVIDKAKDLLAKKLPFIWNSTNLSMQMRSKTLSLLHNYAANVELIYLEESANVIFKRNSLRDTTLSNKDLKKMLLRWELPKAGEAQKIIWNVNGIKYNE